MVEVPVDTAVANPVAAPIVATPVDAELHEPPLTVLLNVDVPPAHSMSVPAIGGLPFTVTVVVTEQPEGVV